MLNIIKSILFWVLKKNNRGIGIKYTKMAINLASIISSETKSTKDDKAINEFKKVFDSLTGSLSKEKKLDIVKKISEDKGPLAELSAVWDEKEGAKIGFKLGNSL